MPVAEATASGERSSVAPSNIVLGVPIGLVRVNDQYLDTTGQKKQLAGVMVDKSVDAASYAEVRFRNLHPAMVDDELFRESSIMSIDTGYTNREVIYRGTFTMRRPRFEFGGSSQIVVCGIESSAAAMMRDQKRRVFETMTYSEIVAALADNYGFEFVGRKLREKIPSLTQAGISDYELLQDIARRSGMTFSVANSVLRFFEPLGAITNTKIANGDPNVDWIKVKVEGEGVSAAFNATPINPKTGERLALVSEFDSDNIIDFEDSQSSVRFTRLASIRNIFADAEGNLISETEIQRMLDGLANIGSKNIVRVEAQVVGYPYMEPRQLVEFLGIGARFSGTYYLTRVIHRIVGRTYKTIVEGWRAYSGTYRVSPFQDSDGSVGGTPEDSLQDVSKLSQAQGTVS